MTALIDEKLQVVENLIETIERQIHSMDLKDPKTKLIDVLHLYEELNDLLHAKINLLIEKHY
jgi:hypothetical protein